MRQTWQKVISVDSDNEEAIVRRSGRQRSVAPLQLIEVADDEEEVGPPSFDSAEKKLTGDMDNGDMDKMKSLLVPTPVRFNEGRETLYDPSSVPGAVPPSEFLYDESHPLLKSSADEEHSSSLMTKQWVGDGLKRGYLLGRLCGMCSHEEMVDKQRTSTTSDLERLNASLNGDTEARLVNQHLAVKSFQRSDASKVFTADSVRPVVWCRRTVHRLCTLQLEADRFLLPWIYKREKEDEGYTFLDVYNFIRDRLRGVWQDLTVQHCGMHRAFVESLEISVRFLILADEELCEDEQFNSVQNGALISTCLNKLMGAYKEVRDYGLMTNMERKSEDDQNSMLVFQSPYEDEFWVYRLIASLSTGEETHALTVLAELPVHFREQSDLIQLGLAVVDAFRAGNLPRYMKLKASAPYLVRALMNKFVNLLRVRCLFTLGSQRSPSLKMPWSVFQRQLGFESGLLTAALDFCKTYNIALIYYDTSSGGVPGDRGIMSLGDKKPSPSPPVRHLMTLDVGLDDLISETPTIQQGLASKTDNINKTPQSVSLSDITRLSPIDLTPKRLRCRRFKSVEATQLANDLSQPRARLIDPLFSTLLNYDQIFKKRPKCEVSPFEASSIFASSSELFAMAAQTTVEDSGLKRAAAGSSILKRSAHPFEIKPSPLVPPLTPPPPPPKLKCSSGGVSAILPAPAAIFAPPDANNLPIKPTEIRLDRPFSCLTGRQDTSTSAVVDSPKISTNTIRVDSLMVPLPAPQKSEIATIGSVVESSVLPLPHFGLYQSDDLDVKQTPDSAMAIITQQPTEAIKTTRGKRKQTELSAAIDVSDGGDGSSVGVVGVLDVSGQQPEDPDANKRKRAMIGEGSVSLLSQVYAPKLLAVGDSEAAVFNETVRRKVFSEDGFEAILVKDEEIESTETYFKRRKRDDNTRPYLSVARSTVADMLTSLSGTVLAGRERTSYDICATLSSLVETSQTIVGINTKIFCVGSNQKIPSTFSMAKIFRKLSLSSSQSVFPSLQYETVEKSAENSAPTAVLQETTSPVPPPPPPYKMILKMRPTSESLPSNTRSLWVTDFSITCDVDFYGNRIPSTGISGIGVLEVEKPLSVSLSQCKSFEQFDYQVKFGTDFDQLTTELAQTCHQLMLASSSDSPPLRAVIAFNLEVQLSRDLGGLSVMRDNQFLESINAEVCTQIVKNMRRKPDGDALLKIFCGNSGQIKLFAFCIQVHIIKLMAFNECEQYSSAIGDVCCEEDEPLDESRLRNMTAAGRNDRRWNSAPASRKLSKGDLGFQRRQVSLPPPTYPLNEELLQHEVWLYDSESIFRLLDVCIIHHALSEYIEHCQSFQNAVKDLRTAIYSGKRDYYVPNYRQMEPKNCSIRWALHKTDPLALVLITLWKRACAQQVRFAKKVSLQSLIQNLAKELYVVSHSAFWPELSLDDPESQLQSSFRKILRKCEEKWELRRFLSLECFSSKLRSLLAETYTMEGKLCNTVPLMNVFEVLREVLRIEIEGVLSLLIKVVEPAQMLGHRSWRRGQIYDTNQMARRLAVLTVRLPLPLAIGLSQSLASPWDEKRIPSEILNGSCIVIVDDDKQKLRSGEFVEQKVLKAATLLDLSPVPLKAAAPQEKQVKKTSPLPDLFDLLQERAKAVRLAMLKTNSDLLLETTRLWETHKTADYLKSSSTSYHTQNTHTKDSWYHHSDITNQKVIDRKGSVVFGKSSSSSIT